VRCFLDGLDKPPIAGRHSASSAAKSNFFLLLGMEASCDASCNDTGAIYKHHPLSAHGNETRMLRLVNRSRFISCRLRVVSLDDMPDYLAASYVWGDPLETRLIQVDGKPFSVGINLWHFLLQMQRD
jgi:hypothetical protein